MQVHFTKFMERFFKYDSSLSEANGKPFITISLLNFLLKFQKKKKMPNQKICKKQDNKSEDEYKLINDSNVEKHKKLKFQRYMGIGPYNIDNEKKMLKTYIMNYFIIPIIFILMMM